MKPSRSKKSRDSSQASGIRTILRQEREKERRSRQEGISRPAVVLRPRLRPKRPARMRRTGRIVNRLSSDLQKVDTMLQGTMQYLLLQAPGRREPSHRCMKPGKTKGMLGHFRPVVPIWTIIAKQSLYTKLIEYVRQFSVYLCVRIF